MNPRLLLVPAITESPKLMLAIIKKGLMALPVSFLVPGTVAKQFWSRDDALSDAAGPFNPFPITTIRQAKAIKKDLGGQWATPSKRAKAPSAAAASRHDISLDNLVDNKRRSARTSSVSTPSSAVTTPKDGAKGRVHASLVMVINRFPEL